MVARHLDPVSIRAATVDGVDSSILIVSLSRVSAIFCSFASGGSHQRFEASGYWCGQGL